MPPERQRSDASASPCFSSFLRLQAFAFCDCFVYAARVYFSFLSLFPLHLCRANFLFLRSFSLLCFHHWISDEDADDETQPTNINDLFDFALELLWSLVTKNGWDMTKLPDISEGFSYVSIVKWDGIETVESKIKWMCAFKAASDTMSSIK